MRRKQTEVSSLTPFIRKKLTEVLPEGDASEALERLAHASFPMAPRDSFGEERIHLAIVKLVCDPWDSIYAELSPMEKFDSPTIEGRPGG